MGRELLTFWIDEFEIYFLENSPKSTDGHIDLLLFLYLSDESESFDHLLGCRSEYLIVVADSWIYLESGTIVSSENETIK